MIAMSNLMSTMLVIHPQSHHKIPLSRMSAADAPTNTRKNPLTGTQL